MFCLTEELNCIFDLFDLLLRKPVLGDLANGNYVTLLPRPGQVKHFVVATANEVLADFKVAFGPEGIHVGISGFKICIF